MSCMIQAGKQSTRSRHSSGGHEREVRLVGTRRDGRLSPHTNRKATQYMQRMLSTAAEAGCISVNCVHSRAFQFGQKKFRFDSIRQSDKFAACTLIFK